MRKEPFYSPLCLIDSHRSRPIWLLTMWVTMETENESDRFVVPLLGEEAAAGIRGAHLREVRLLLRTKGSCSRQPASPGATFIVQSPVLQYLGFLSSAHIHRTKRSIMKWMSQIMSTSLALDICVYWL